MCSQFGFVVLSHNQACCLILHGTPVGKQLIPLTAPKPRTPNPLIPLAHLRLLWPILAGWILAPRLEAGGKA